MQFDMREIILLDKNLLHSSHNMSAMYILQSKVVHSTDVVFMPVDTWDVKGIGWAQWFKLEQVRKFIVDDTLPLSVGLML